MECLKNKIGDVEANSNDKNLNKFKKGYHPGTNLAKYENGDLLVDLQSVLKRVKNYSCQPLNLHGLNDV
jgi:hypothetical protein